MKNNRFGNIIMDQELSATQDGESVIVGGYLNCHIRRSKEGRKHTLNTRTGNPRIKWCRLNKDQFPKIKFRETVLGKVRRVESVQEWWEERSRTIFREYEGGVEHYS